MSETRQDGEPGWNDVFGRVSPTDDAPRETTPKPRKPPTDKALDDRMTQAEVRKDITLAFNAFPRLFRLPNVEEVTGGGEQLRFAEEEFNEAAEALIYLFNQHSQLRIVMRVLAPLAGLSAMIGAIERLIEAFRLKRQMDAAKRAEKQSGQPAGEQFDGEGTVIPNGQSTRGSIFPTFGKRTS